MLPIALVFTAVTLLLMMFPITLSAWLGVGMVAVLGWWSPRFSIRLLASAVTAIACVSVHLSWVDQFSLQAMEEQREVLISGRVADLPERTQYGQRFSVELDSFDKQSFQTWQRPRILLSCYRDNCLVQAGERWRWIAKLKRPHGLVNFFGFDYEQYLFAHHVRATGSIVDDARNQRLQTNKGLAYWRQSLFQSLQNTSLHHANIIAGLSLGADDDIPREIWDDLRRTGTTHLIAISGMHIVFFAVMVGGVAGWLWRQGRRTTLWIATPYVQAIAGSLAAVGYAALAGFSVPTVRALLMTLLFAGVLLWRKQWSATTVLSLIAVLMLAIDPCSILLPGFVLSFAAVAVLLWLSHRKSLSSWWRKAIFTQWSIGLGLMPLTLLLFEQVSLVSAVVNLIAVPFVSFVCTPLALLGVALLMPLPEIAAWILQLADHSIDLFVQFNHWCAQWPWAIWQAPQLSWGVRIALVAAVVLALTPFALRWKFASLVLAIAIGFDVITTPRPYAAITLLDVGQGLAISVESAHNVAIYDAGPRSEKFDAGRDIVLPHINALGFSRAHSVIISHADTDHAGGALSLFTVLPDAQWQVGEPLPGIAAAPCQALQQWQMDHIQFTMLAPLNTQWQRNNRSCVVKINIADQQWLLTGDIEKKAEQGLLEASPEALNVDVIVVPHHGSRTSSTDEFITAVSPQLALISAGYKNRFDHPKADVIARYRDNGSDVLNTADTGAIRFVWSAADHPPQILFARSTPRRWRQPPPLVML